jgi:hypothetical protein
MNNVFKYIVLLFYSTNIMSEIVVFFTHWTFNTENVINKTVWKIMVKSSTDLPRYCLLKNKSYPPIYSQYLTIILNEHIILL